MSTALTCTLPLWPKETRGFPNVFARSSLFNAASLRKGKRQQFKKHAVATLKDVEITYSGEELRQDDEDVFLQILHIARFSELGTRVFFTANSIITELGWSRNSASYLRLTECLERMKVTSVEVVVKDSAARQQRCYSGSLIRLFRWRQDMSTGATTREWEVLLEPEIVALFDPSGYTQLDWRLRMTLPPLAKWLHSFYHSHAEPFPIKVETICRLTGSQARTLYQFRYKLRLALELLTERGFFISAVIDPASDRVVVKRAADLKRLA
jgi:hypothetical protein